MDPKFSFPASPGTPLFAISPERANRQQIPQSPSLPGDLVGLRDPITNTHVRTSSDVQGKVAQFNSLSKEAIQRRRDNEAALKRAVMGREEAESETRRLREDNCSLRREIEEGRSRERRVAERVEGVMVRRPTQVLSGTILIWLAGRVTTRKRNTCTFSNSLREGSEKGKKRGFQILKCIG